MLMFDQMIKDENVSTRVRASTEQKTSAQNFGPKAREINRSKGHSRALDQLRITIEVQPHRLACQNLSAEGIRTGLMSVDTEWCKRTCNGQGTTGLLLVVSLRCYLNLNAKSWGGLAAFPI